MSAGVALPPRGATRWARDARHRHHRRPPRLRVAAGPVTAEPTVWMICPDWDRPSGGIRRQYRVVDVLNRAGLPAAVVHRRSGWSCSWFEHETRVVGAPEIEVSRRDLLVVPEIYGASILDLPRGVRRVIFNQGPYLMLESLRRGGRAELAPYLDDPDLAAVVVVSADSAALVHHAFPRAPVLRVRHGVDTALHHPGAGDRAPRLAYMPRRRAGEAADVLRLLELRGALDGWEVVPIDGCSERRAADLLRSSRIFMSLGRREGFGLPPLEALACGCLVAGFTGFGGRELFREPFAVAVEDGDVVALARVLERLMRRTESEPAATCAAAAAGARFALERYSPEAERRDLVGVFGPLLAS